MLKRIFILMAIVLLASCDDEKELRPSSMNKTPYTGNELRTDGYYYSNPSADNTRGVAVLYRDGICMFAFTKVESRDTFDYIENGFLCNNATMSKLWNWPATIGVFNVNNNSLTCTVWEPQYYDIPTYTYSSEILNDTTFRLTKRIDDDTQFNDTYHFKQFSPKPDSTNKFIK